MPCLVHNITRKHEGAITEKPIRVLFTWLLVGNDSHVGVCVCVCAVCTTLAIAALMELECSNVWFPGGRRGGGTSTPFSLNTTECAVDGHRQSVNANDRGWNFVISDGHCLPLVHKQQLQKYMLCQTDDGVSS